MRLGSLGGTFGNPQRVRQSTAVKQYLVNLRLKISPLVATIIRSFSGNETSYCGGGTGTFLLDCRRSGVRIPMWKKKFDCAHLPSLSYKCYVAVCLRIYELSDTVNLVLYTINHSRNTIWALLGGGHMPQVPQWHNVSDRLL